jgi:hypothetical protein
LAFEQAGVNQMVERVRRNHTIKPQAKVKAINAPSPREAPRLSQPYRLSPELKDLIKVDGEAGFNLRYQEKPCGVIGKPNVRYYFIGHFNIGFAEEWREEGKWVIYLAHRSTYCTGEAFKDEQALHEFLIGEASA